MTDFKKYGKDDGAFAAGCIGLIAGLIIIALVIFAEPLIICEAWRLFAVGMFGLPQLEYWTAFWVNLAIGCLFGGARFNGGGKNDL